MPASNRIPEEFYAGYITYDNGNTVYLGPYKAAGVAQGQVTSELRYARGVADSGVKKGTVMWQDYNYAQDKKERAKQLRAEKKQKELDRIKNKQDQFWEELGL